MKPTILFLCPHGAAKSVLAAAYCQQLATQHGLDWHISAAGTEPDATVAPAVAALLASEGLDVSHHLPRHVTTAELATAQRIISLGCDVSDLAPPQAKIEHWDDVPPPSQALHAARDLIYARVERLVTELSRS
jgi:protein-tyrosine-phosphatase